MSHFARIASPPGPVAAKAGRRDTTASLVTFRRRDTSGRPPTAPRAPPHRQGRTPETASMHNNSPDAMPMLFDRGTPTAIREKLEGGRRFRMETEFNPAGDQPTAIAELAQGIRDGERDQVLLGATGTGKTYTMAKIIEETQRPAIILAPNKTLAAQLYGEFKGYFPDNAVEYFVSYYDYYQPEAYVPRSDTYIEKESPDQRTDRPDAALRHPGAARTRRRHHRRLRLLHLRHRLGRDLRRDDRRPPPGQALRPAPDHRRPRGAAIPPQRRRLRPRRLPGPRRLARNLARPPRGPRLAPLLLRRGARIDHRIRPAHRREDRHVRPRPHLRQLALRHPAPHPQPGHPRHPRRAENPPRPACRRRKTPRSPAPRTAHQLRPRDDGGHRRLQRHRELLPLPHRPRPRRAAAHPLRVHPRQRHRLRRRIPRLGAADRRHVSRRLPAQDHAGRARLPPALLHRQPAR